MIHCACMYMCASEEFQELWSVAWTVHSIIALDFLLAEETSRGVMYMKHEEATHRDYDDHGVSNR